MSRFWPISDGNQPACHRAPDNDEGELAGRTQQKAAFRGFSGGQSEAPRGKEHDQRLDDHDRRGGGEDQHRRVGQAKKVEDSCRPT